MVGADAVECAHGRRIKDAYVELVGALEGGKNVVAIFPAEGRSVDWHMHYLSLPLARLRSVRVGERLRIRFGYAPGGSI